MEHWTKIIDSVAWPIVVLVIFYMMRAPIKSLLPLVENIKYKDFVISFRKGLEEVKAVIEESGIGFQASPGEKEEIFRLVEISPLSAIVESWKDLEGSALNKIEELVKDKEKLTNARKRPITHLEITGALIPSTARAISELRKLRNQAAHSKKLVVAKEDVLEYVTLAKTISKQIDAITELPKQKLTVLTLLILEFNHLIDTGKYQGITIEDAHREIQNKNIIPYLAKETAGDSDFSMFTEGDFYADYVKYYNEQMYQIYGGSAGDERRRWGVKNSGLCLLVAWTNEIVQQGAGWHPYG